LVQLKQNFLNTIWNNAAGYTKAEIVVNKTGKEITVTLPDETMYVVLAK
jgi:hypothetical protein